jgi:hypothetical protein
LFADDREERREREEAPALYPDRRCIEATRLRLAARGSRCRRRSASLQDEAEGLQRNRARHAANGCRHAAAPAPDRRQSRVVESLMAAAAFDSRRCDTAVVGEFDTHQDLAGFLQTPRQRRVGGRWPVVADHRQLGSQCQRRSLRQGHWRAGRCRRIDGRRRHGHGWCRDSRRLPRWSRQQRSLWWRLSPRRLARPRGRRSPWFRCWLGERWRHRRRDEVDVQRRHVRVGRQQTVRPQGVNRCRMHDSDDAGRKKQLQRPPPRAASR